MDRFAARGGRERFAHGASPRHRYQGKALCRADAQRGDADGPPADVNEEPWLLGAAHDLSASGVGFILHRRYEPGTALTIDLQRPLKDSWTSRPAWVVRATPRPEGDWTLGCAFVNAWSEAELQGWLMGAP